MCVYMCLTSFFFISSALFIFNFFLRERENINLGSEEVGRNLVELEKGKNMMINLLFKSLIKF